MAAELVLSHLPSTSSKDEAFIERHKDVGIENWTPETVFGYEAFIERHMDVGIENWTPETVFGYLGTQPYLSTWLPTLGADHPLKTVSGRTLLVLPELNPDIYLREFFDGNVVAFAHARGMARQLAQHMPYARTKPSDVDAAAVQRMVEEAIKDRLCQCGTCCGSTACPGIDVSQLVGPMLLHGSNNILRSPCSLSRLVGCCHHPHALSW